MLENQEFPSDLKFSSELNPDRIPYELWTRDVLRENKRFFLSNEWRSAVKFFSPDTPECEVLYTQVRTDDKRTSYAGKFKQTLFHLSLENGRAFSNVAGNAQNDCDETHQFLREIVKPSEPIVGQVPFAIWSAERGGSSLERSLEAPTWTEIKENYAPQTAQVLENLASLQGFPSNEGKLLIWHGSPGTGKTFALRALARQWQEWCEFHYIYDPETFLGPDKKYLYKVALGDDDIDYHNNSEESEAPKTRLVILEDVGELITIEAKQSVGQAMSRLLNLTDGILGQGLKTYFLITANEELKKLHPAITRPGRCLTNLKFLPLDIEQSNQWAAKFGLKLPDKKSWSIADLYALKEGQKVQTNITQNSGFGSFPA